MTSTFSLKTLIVDFYNGICASLAIHKAWPIFLKSYKVRYRTAQSFLFNGIIYLTSIMLVEYTIFPLIRHVIGTLSGEEAGLLGYWKMDAGMLDKAYNLVKYDKPVPNTTYIAKVGNNFNLSGNLSNPDDFPWWTTDSPNQYLSSFTAENGSYLIKNIAYDANNYDGTQFSVTPYIRLDYYEHQNINFVDNSLYAVTGKIHYQGYTNCTIDSAEVLIKYLGDTEFKSTVPPTYTSESGQFRMDIEPEKTFVIKTEYKDHLFPQTYSFYNITSDKNIDFIDPTITKSLHGSVVGGICEEIDLGPYKIKYTEKNKN